MSILRDGYQASETGVCIFALLRVYASREREPPDKVCDPVPGAIFERVYFDLSRVGERGSPLQVIHLSYARLITMRVCWFTPPSKLSIEWRRALLGFFDAS